MLDLHEGRGVEVAEAIEEDNDPYESRGDEEVCVPAQPQEVQSHLLPKVVPVQRTCIREGLHFYQHLKMYFQLILIIMYALCNN